MDFVTLWAQFCSYLFSDHLERVSYFLQLQDNLLQHLSSLVQSSASDFWRSGRFLVHTGRQLASHKDGKHESQGGAFSFFIVLRLFFH